MEEQSEAASRCREGEEKATLLLAEQEAVHIALQCKNRELADKVAQ